MIVQLEPKRERVDLGLAVANHSELGGIFNEKVRTPRS